jgi:hypothetical protein
MALEKPLCYVDEQFDEEGESLGFEIGTPCKWVAGLC